MIRALCSVAVLALLPAAAKAASFDCAKARTGVEKEICGDRELSKLDEDLAAAWRAALAVTHRPGKLAADQRDWLRERDHGPELAEPSGPHTGETLKENYRQRVAVLKAEAARGAAAKATFSRDHLHKRCGPIGRSGASGCSPTGAGRLPGDAGAPVLVFQTEQLENDEGAFGGFTAYEAAEGSALRPVAWVYDWGVWKTPQLFRSPAGWLLVAEAETVGAEDEPYIDTVILRQKDGRWRDVATDRFWRDLRNRMPQDRWVDDGAATFDFNAMTGRAPTGWSDGREGPGGSARFTYVIEGDALVLKSLTLEPAARR